MPLSRAADYESLGDANSFYLFDEKTELLQEVMVFYGNGASQNEAENCYSTLKGIFSERYGDPADENPETTFAYDYALEKNSEIIDSAEWTVPDIDGNVNIELFYALVDNKGYFTYIGLKHY